MAIETIVGNADGWWYECVSLELEPNQFVLLFVNLYFVLIENRFRCSTPNTTLNISTHRHTNIQLVTNKWNLIFSLSLSLYIFLFINIWQTLENYFVKCMSMCVFMLCGEVSSLMCVWRGREREFVICYCNSICTFLPFCHCKYFFVCYIVKCCCVMLVLGVTHYLSLSLTIVMLCLCSKIAMPFF